ncbi:MAG: hypothetical protein N2490_06800 [Ignavibacteria bacterium]|nr:hypothetical protein [Ignavibacteria bacterium]
MKISHKIIYFLFIQLSVIISFFPLDVVRRFAVILGNLIYLLLPIRKKILKTNLDLCYPEKDKKWKSNIARLAYVNICIVILEILYMFFLSSKKLYSSVINGDLSLIQDCINKEKGLIIASGHYSNWEYFGGYIATQIPVRASCIVKTQSNLFVNERINYLRNKFKYQAIEVGVSLREVYERLKKNEVIMMLIDQSAHPDYSSYVNFFNVNVSSFSGAAKFALKYKTELIFAYFRRDKNLKYNLYSKKIDFSDLKEYNKENIDELTQRLQNSLEECIREEPSQWLWFHRRFKNIKSINANATEVFDYSDSIYR